MFLSACGPVSRNESVRLNTFAVLEIGTSLPMHVESHFQNMLQRLHRLSWTISSVPQLDRFKYEDIIYSVS